MLQQLADLKFPRLPNRTPVNLSISIMSYLHQALVDYAGIYAETYGLQEQVCAPRLLPSAEVQTEARHYFGKWFPSADAFLASARFLTDRGDTNEASFNLHQAAERLYYGTLLVLTLYSSKSHKLNFLRTHAEEVAPRLIAAWPRGDKFSRRCFELLRQAYVSARYSPHHEISDEELRWLAARVTALQALVKSVCDQRLAPRD